MMSVAGKMLAMLREAMKQHSLSAFIIPSSDPHNSEYVRDDYKCRAHITNFTGSSGTCLVTMDVALMWTDGRYWLEASDSLYPEWRLMKAGHPDVPTLEKWVQTNLGPTALVGMNSYLSTVAEWERRKAMINLVSVPDLVRPFMPPVKQKTSVLFARPEKFCGKRCSEKVAELSAELEQRNCDAMILSALDEIAWLTNLRGADVPFNPVFYAYALVQRSLPTVHLFVDAADGLPAMAEKDLPVELHPYGALEDYLRTLPTNTTFLVDRYQTSQSLFMFLKSIGAGTELVNCGPVQQLKAIKNAVELDGFRRCHVRDGVALTRYLAWLNNMVAVKGDTSITEFSGAKKLEAFRREEENFVQLSFATISSVGPNGAIVHYSPPADGSATIVRDQLYLIDSGAQYLDGTTDVTRTVCFQQPRYEEREAYTLVLKGNLALHSAVWPVNTSGHQLDALARVALWQSGLNYAHGTGHGVGSFLNVHEGPQGIGLNPVGTGAVLKAGMVMSNEPGYYKQGAFGIRIENLEIVVDAPTRHSATGFLSFDTITMVPLCRELIDVSALTETERQQVNKYHQIVREVLTPHLCRYNDSRALEYLEHHTAPL